jgi:F-type H+-transporting ATPase subunit a
MERRPEVSKTNQVEFVARERWTQAAGHFEFYEVAKPVGHQTRKVPADVFPKTCALLMVCLALASGGAPQPALAEPVRMSSDLGSDGQATKVTEGARSHPGPNGPSAEVGPTPQAREIARVLGFPITNSMVVTWIVALALIVSAQLATRKMELVPEGAQNFWEWLVEGLYAFLEKIIGRHLVERTFWFFATIFIFILAANWAGLIPGVGTIGWGHQTAEGFRIDNPLFRGATADLNLTLAMALVFFGLWLYWVMREVGPVGLFRELFTGPKGDMSRLLSLLLLPIFFAAGLVEVISILLRPVALCFRLYGNIFAGDTMLETMSNLIPGFGWLVPIPFYFMELLMGFVQAMVFMLLCAVFTLLECPQTEEVPAAADK